MPLFEDLFSGLVGQVTGQASHLTGAVTQVLLPWAQSLLAHAPPRLAQELARGRACAAPDLKAPGRFGPCETQSAVVCVVCGRPCCMMHAYNGALGDSICWACVAKAQKDAAQQAQAPWDFRPEDRPFQGKRPPPPPGPGGVSPEQARRAALKVMGLEPGATWEEIESTYKKLLAKHHPDRARSAKAKAEAEAKFKQVRSAYDFLQDLKKREAA